MEEKSEKEKRIRAIVKMYYSNPKVQEVLVKFAQDRETVPRYFEGFGKRPDMIQYPSDIMGLVSKGATSFHCSEELWNSPLDINNEMSPEQFDNLRKGWDLLIDIDSPYLDLSKIAAQLVVRALEFHGVMNYGIKFSGSKGFHIIVGWKAFPKEFEGRKVKDMFPEWPRAITEYLFSWIEQIFMKEAGKIMSFGKSEENKIEIHCTQCSRLALSGMIAKYNCSVCGMIADRKNVTLRKKIKCMNPGCPGVLEIVEEKPYSYCELCKDPDNERISLDSTRHPENFEEKRGEKISEHAKFDLVLVAPRHLFRMPYSLHEKTALASIVLKKEQLENFVPRDANALSVKPVEFYPENTENEAARLLKTAIEWKKQKEMEQEEVDKKFYGNYKTASSDSGEREYEEIDAKNITDDMFPDSIKKLLKGLKDGRKRGLFILITFFRSLNYSPEEINTRIREWNKLNPVPLKEGYVKSQVDWHLKQKRKILPPNYENDAFYKDLGIIDKRPEVKNPLVELKRNMKKGR